jgi:hypothetical protein
MTMIHRAWAAGLLALLAIWPAGPGQAATGEDYPTSTRVDYVFACMKANGETRDSLDRCSCSIDVIATLLPYERYVTAETFMSMAQMAGERAAPFRSSEQAHAAVDALRRAQAEAEVRCF